MNIKIEYITNTGLVRDHNEDALLINEMLLSNISMESVETVEIQADKMLCAVADGMGGYNMGEVASKFVLDELKNSIDTLYDEASILQKLRKIKSDLDHYAQKNTKYFNMGTVIAGVLAVEEKVYVFSVGDCRVYVNSFGYANQLSRDHSLVYALYDSGEITYDEIRTHPKKHVVTSAFIANKDQALESIYIKEVGIDVIKDGLLLCSDGTWEPLDIKEIENCLASKNIVESLKLKILETEAKDNFSVIYIKDVTNE